MTEHVFQRQKVLENSLTNVCVRGGGLARNTRRKRSKLSTCCFKGFLASFHLLSILEDSAQNMVNKKLFLQRQAIRLSLMGRAAYLDFATSPRSEHVKDGPLDQDSGLNQTEFCRQIISLISFLRCQNMVWVNGL